MRSERNTRLAVVVLLLSSASIILCRLPSIRAPRYSGTRFSLACDHGLSLQTHRARDALMLGTLARRRSGTGSQRELARRNQGWGDEGFDQRGGY